MKIELKKLSIYTCMSQETIAFHADVYIDGKKEGVASNDGRGGSCEVHWEQTMTRERLEALGVALRELVPPEFQRIGKLDYVLSDMVAKALAAKEDKRLQKSIAKNDAYFRERCAKLGRAAARYKITGEGQISYRWVEYLPGDEATARADAEKKYGAMMSDWTVVS